MFAFVAEDRLDVVVTRAREVLGLFKALGFADCAFPRWSRGLDLVVTNSGDVLGDEIGSG